MDETNLFNKGLEEKNKKILSMVKKVDLHNHASYSCRKDYLKKNNVLLGSEEINNIEKLIQFSRKYITPLKKNEQGLYLVLKGNFENCLNTGISFVSTNIDFKDCIRTFHSDTQKFINFLKQFHYDNLKIEWILEISRDSYKEEYKNLIMDLLNSHFFGGLDLVSTENAVPNSKFIDFYRKANALNLKTKVHAGEQLGADYVKQCIIDFNPKEIQHGINIIEDIDVVALAKSKNIIFNVCPSSNLVLGYVDNIENHPIRKMYDLGLKITIATDDILYFDSDINDEYLKLYENKVLSLEELNEIRVFGNSLLNKCDKG